jgi:hypothetical protein
MDNSPHLHPPPVCKCEGVGWKRIGDLDLTTPKIPVPKSSLPGSYPGTACMHMYFVPGGRIGNVAGYLVPWME